MTKTDPLAKTISEKRMRKSIVEKQRTGKSSFKNKSSKPNLRSLKKNEISK